MNMINVRRLTVMTFLGAGMLPGISAQGSLLQADTLKADMLKVATLQADTLQEMRIPTQWDLQSCIDYAKEQNITIRKNRITAAGTQIDVKTAKAALFPSLSFSTGHQVVNRPYQETSSRVSGSEIISSNSKTSYNGNYGLNASWTLYNGNKRLKTIQQEKLNNQIAELDVATSENNIQESIAQVYIQILYAAESVRVNENTLQVSIAQRDRGQELLNAGSIAKSDLAQLEAQVSTDRYQLVTAQATLEDVYISALGLRPEIEASKLNVEASELGINIAKSSYFPTISLSAGIGTNHTSGSDFTFGEQVKNGWNNSIGLSVSVPIFNNRQTKSAVQKAKLQYETSMLSLLDEQKALYKTIESLWLDANSAQQRYAAANEKLKSTKISYELTSEQFNLGMKNTVELLTEKNNLLQAQQEQLQAKYMAILNTQLLKFYQGDQLAL